MGAFFLAIPLMIFVLFVLPVWLWLHYNKGRTRENSLSAEDTQRLQQLTRDAQQMRDRIQTLEAILDAEHPNWRQP